MSKTTEHPKSIPEIEVKAAKDLKNLSASDMVMGKATAAPKGDLTGAELARNTGELGIPPSKGNG